MNITKMLAELRAARVLGTIAVRARLGRPTSSYESRRVLRRNQAAKLGQVSAQFSLFVIGELDFLKKPATKGVHSGEKNILRERCAFVRPIIEFHVTIAQGESVGQRGVRLLYSV